MKKKILVLIGILLLLTIISVLWFYLTTSSENNTNLTIAEEIVLTEEEKEIIFELQRLKDSLLNPEPQDNTDSEMSNSITSEDFTMTPTESIEFSEFCKKLYEVRKFISDGGKILYLFDMDTEFKDNEVIRRIIVTQEGKLIYYTLTENDYDINQLENSTTETTDNGLTVYFGNEFIKALYEQITKSIQNMWEKALTFENVDYDTILNKIQYKER